MHSGSLAISTRTLPLRAAVWVSEDGFEWQEIDDESFTGSGQTWMSSVAVGGPGLVAVGVDTDHNAPQSFVWEAAVWVSEDGLDWERVDDPALTAPGPQEMWEVLTFESGLIAVGVEGGTDIGGDVAVWVSEDGWSWERVADPALVEPGEQGVGDGGDTQVVAGGPGLVAVAHDRQGERTDAAVWVSVDGHSWERVDDPALTGPGNQSLHAVTVGGPGLVAVGSDDPDPEDGLDNAGVWVSPDGYAWTQVVDEDLADFQLTYVSSVTAYGDGLVAVGWEQVPSGRLGAAVWVSTDGLDWTKVQDPSFLSDTDSPWMWTITPAGPGLVAVGRSSIGWVARPPESVTGD